MALRNESPPPDNTDEDISYDLISDTAFSKFGFINLIKRIIIKLQEFCSKKSERDYEDDLDFDDDLCKLMDMTVESGVLQYVADIPLVEPLCDAICVNKSDRLNEIFLGIIANFASNDVLCQQMSDNVDLVNLLISFWSNPNASFLKECARLLKMVLRNQCCSPTWVNCIRTDETYLGHVLFILKSSTNSELLVSSIQVVTELMNRDDDLCEKWACHEVMLASLIARSEAEWFSNNDIEYFHFLMYLFSTHEGGITCLIANINTIFCGFCEYLDQVVDEEPRLITLDHCHSNLRLILPTIDIVVVNMADLEALEVLQSTPSMLVNLARVAHASHLQGDDPLAQQVDSEIGKFLATVVRITHSVMTSIGEEAVRWPLAVSEGVSKLEAGALIGCLACDPHAMDVMDTVMERLRLSQWLQACTDRSYTPI